MKEFFATAEALIEDKLEIARLVLQIFRLEVKLAELSIFPLLLTLCLLVIILGSFWLSLNGVILYAFYLLMESLGYGLCCILLLNFLFILFLIHRIKLHLRNLSFKKTRAYFQLKHEE